MEIDIDHRRRRRPGEPRLLEKQVRPEVVERCLQFIDMTIHQIIYQENIYPRNLFSPRQMYRTIVYQCNDKDIASYITLCVASLRDLFSQQLFDMVSIGIVRNNRVPIILRRYLIELHVTHDPCLRAVYDNTRQLVHQLDRAFHQCIATIKSIKPLGDNEDSYGHKRWIFQLRSSNDDTNRRGISIRNTLRRNPIYREFLLINEQSGLVSHSEQSAVSSIKSIHTERIKLQFMCEDDKYEQDKFLQSNQYSFDNTLTDQPDTESGTDSDPDDHHDNVQESGTSSTERQREGFEIWPLTTMNNPPICQTDDPNIRQSDIEPKSNDTKRYKIPRQFDIDNTLLFGQYNSTEKFNRDIADVFRYSSDDEDQPEPLCVPDDSWQAQIQEDQDNDEEEDL